MLKINPIKTFFFVAAIVLLIFFHYLGILAPVENLFIKAVSPIFSGFHLAGSYLRHAYNEQAGKINLAEENEELRGQIASLINENVKLKILEEENEVLRDQLGFFSSHNNKYLISDVISRSGFDSSKPNQTLIISKGEQDGLKPGLVVVGGQGIIVGKIISTKDHLSEICLTINPECKLAATIQSEDRTSGIAQGDLGLTIKMNFIPQTKRIEKGDVVITSGLEQDIPRGLAIGSVSQINKENNELWQNAIIEPLVDFNDLTIVSVLLPN